MPTSRRAPHVIDLKRRLLRLRFVRVGRSGLDLAALFAALCRNPLVDPELYAQQRGSRVAGRPGAAAHWLLRGAGDGLLLGPLLLPAAPTQEVVSPRRGVAAALRRASRLRRVHFPLAAEHPLVDSSWYQQEYPDAAGWPGGPLAFWTAVGRSDHHLTHPDLSAPVDLIALATAVIAGGITAGGNRRDGEPAGLVALTAGWPVGSDTLAAISRAIGTTLVVSTDTSPTGRLVVAALDRLPSYKGAETLVAALQVLADAGHTDDIVILAGSPVEVRPVVVKALVDGLLAADAAMGIGPVILGPDGVVAAAGLEATGSAPPSAGLSADDLAREPAPHQVAALPPDLFAVRRGALRKTLLTLHDSAQIGVLLNHSTSTEEESADSIAGASASAASSDLTMAELVLRLGATGPLLLAPAITVRRTRGSSSASTSAIAPRPIQVNGAAPQLRWAIKSAHPAGTAGLAWGDLHFARGLAEALERLGQFAVVDPLDAWHRPTADQDDVVVVLRGLHEYLPLTHKAASGSSTTVHSAADSSLITAGSVRPQASVLWVISHPELVSDAELSAADFTFAASLSWSAEARARGFRVQPLLQCTDPARFNPEAGPAGGGPEMLFVGNTRKARRPIVEMAVEAGLPLQVVGAGWTDRLPATAIRAEHIDNTELAALYRSAGVVLNDHWPHMAELGFLSNRLFDLTGCGAAWVSDEAADINEVFGDVARTVSSATELAELLNNRTWPTEATRRQAATRISNDHSFDARAKTLLAAVTPLFG
jgi:hypothetical protein